MTVVTGGTGGTGQTGGTGGSGGTGFTGVTGGTDVTDGTGGTGVCLEPTCLPVSTEVLLRCRGGRAEGVPAVPAAAAAQATAPWPEDGGGHQLPRAQAARQRDRGLKWESPPHYRPLACSEGAHGPVGDKSGGKW